MNIENLDNFITQAIKDVKHKFRSRNIYMHECSESKVFAENKKWKDQVVSPRKQRQQQIETRIRSQMDWIRIKEAKAAANRLVDPVSDGLDPDPGSKGSSK